MNRIAPSLAPLVLAACTFNASWLDHDVEARTETGRFEMVSLATTTPGEALEDASLRVMGSARGGATAHAHITGILGVGDDPTEIASHFAVEWTPIVEGRLGVRVDALPGVPDRVWIDQLVVEVPSERDVVLATDDGSVEVTGISGRVEAVAGSGSIVVEATGIVELAAGSGSIDATGEAGNVHTGSGSIVVDLARWVDASADSGSIVGTIGGGGSIVTGSGSIDVELRGELDRDLMLMAGSGSIVLGVPRGASMTLDLEAGDGSVAVDVGRVRYGGERYQGVVGDGGFTVWARTGSGSIVIVER